MLFGVANSCTPFLSQAAPHSHPRYIFRVVNGQQELTYHVGVLWYCPWMHTISNHSCTHSYVLIGLTMIKNSQHTTYGVVLSLPAPHSYHRCSPFLLTSLANSQQKLTYHLQFFGVVTVCYPLLPTTASCINKSSNDQQHLTYQLGCCLVLSLPAPRFPFHCLHLHWCPSYLSSTSQMRGCPEQ